MTADAPTRRRPCCRDPARIAQARARRRTQHRHFQHQGELFALSDTCPHKGGSLSKGKLTGLVESLEPGDYKYSRPGEIIRCPWHNWEFDVRTGRSWCDPQRMRLINYAVSVEPGARLVDGPYVAETFPVEVEGNYIVVETK